MLTNKSKNQNALKLSDIDHLTLEETFNRLDPCTQGHSHRVADLSLKLAKELDKDINEIELYKAALYHDIGKIMISRSILDKPSKLSKEEMEIMKLHSKYSAKILSNHNESRRVINAVLMHHENYDGSGYPFGTVGDDIPVMARVIRVVDSFVALNSRRSYKRAYDRWVCIDIINYEKRMYEKLLIDIFTKLSGRI